MGRCVLGTTPLLYLVVDFPFILLYIISVVGNRQRRRADRRPRSEGDRPGNPFPNLSD